MKRLFLWFSLLACCFPALVFAQTEGGVEEKGLEYLLFEDIPAVGTLTVHDANKTPASVTTITKEQIAITPARNIYDLMEVYVPGMITVTGYEGQIPEIRGIGIDNTKYLLLVNGRKINSDGHGGGISELQNWDLSDVEKIEVIRGPGSTTYGPGAIEAVINITTKNANMTTGGDIGFHYDTKYASTGTHLSYGQQKEKLNYYVYGSIQNTRGFQPKKYAPIGYDGLYYSSNDRNPAVPTWSYNSPNYYKDSQGLPQGKLHIDLQFAEEWEFWARYTRSGQTSGGIHNMYIRQQGVNTYGNSWTGTAQSIEDPAWQTVQDFVTALENKHRISDALRIDTSMSYSSLSYERYFHRDYVSGPIVNGPGDPTHTAQNYSENEVLMKSIANYSFSEKYKLALGLEWAHKKFGPSWGDNWEDFVMGGNSNINGDAAAAARRSYWTPSMVMHHGWATERLSSVGELNLEFDPRFNIILSERTDHHSYTGTLFSPRMALISDWGKPGIFKFIWQKSARLDTEENLRLAELTGSKKNPERLLTYEAIHEFTPVEGTTMTTSYYYNVLNPIIGWTNATMQTKITGHAEYWGWDWELKTKIKDATLGLNHSYVRLRKFGLASGEQRSIFSYAVMTADGMRGYGKDITNIPNQATKLFMDYQATPKWLLHADARIYWDFPGNFAYFHLVDQYPLLNSTARARWAHNMANVNEQRAYKQDVRINFSTSYNFTDNLTGMFYVLNLIEFTSNKRYSIDTGGQPTFTADSRPSWVVEPRTFGIKLDYKF